MIESRQQAVISFAKFNKFAKQLIYNICIAGNAKVFSYADELLSFEEWANDVIEYAKIYPDPIFLDKIASLGSHELLEKYLEEGKDKIPENN